MLTEPTSPAAADLPDGPGLTGSQPGSIVQRLATLEGQNGAGALCTIIHSRGSTPRHTGSKMLVYPDGSIAGTVGGGEVEQRVITAALQAIRDGQSRVLEYSMADPGRGDPGICGGQLEVYVEPIIPRPTLVVVGAGHVGKAVAHLAHWLGFRVVVVDDRSEFCTPQAVPEADLYLPVLMAELPQRMEITPWTYLVLTTRGMNVDVEGLPALLGTPAAYIGVIGSQRRWTTASRQMRERGVASELLERVHSPIGLELNAETPEEIAVSIMAEIIMLRQGGTGRAMSQPQPPAPGD
jgi:xanthine dehydrogenase accessory factor